MFDWFWDFLYGISKSIFRLIDGLMMCANKLCGIEPILVKGEEVSFINYLLTSDRVELAFKVAALMGLVLVSIFAVFAIIRAIGSEKANTTPTRVAMQTVKTVFMFMLIPATMAVLIYVTNVFMNSLYAATLGGSNDGIGRFLCGAFSQDALRSGTDPMFYTDPSFNYMNTGSLRHYIDLDDFDFFFSWIAGFCIMLSLAQSLLMFVDRAISVVLLFIVSPISISTNVIDDGAHFKLWRDQILVKFLTGYGCILGINVFTLIITLISSDSVVFFEDSSFLNNLMKIAFILGGAVSMQRVMALVGNLISAGAGSNELRDNAIASAGFAHAAGKIGSGLKSVATSPFRAVRSAVNFKRDMNNYGAGAAIASRLGFKTDKDYGLRSKGQIEQDKELYKQRQATKTASRERSNQSLARSIGSAVADAISGKGPSESKSGSGSPPPKEKKEINPLMQRIIANDGKKK